MGKSSHQLADEEVDVREVENAEEILRISMQPRPTRTARAATPARATLSEMM